MTEGGPKFEQTTAETWMVAYEEANKLSAALLEKMSAIYGEQDIDEYLKFFNQMWAKLKMMGETERTLRNISVYHAFIGSSLSHKDFKVESRTDLSGENSILAAVRAKLKELEQ